MLTVSSPEPRERGTGAAVTCGVAQCEIKHGRIAMAAWLGYFVQPNFHPLAASCHISNTADPIAVSSL
jgi:hypothetical protein